MSFEITYEEKESILNERYSRLLEQIKKHMNIPGYLRHLSVKELNKLDVKITEILNDLKKVVNDYESLEREEQ